MKKEKLIEDDYPLISGKHAIEEHSKKETLYEYQAGIFRIIDGDVIWQGIIVARNRNEAYTILERYAKENLSTSVQKTIDNMYIMQGLPPVSKRPHGVYKK